MVFILFTYGLVFYLIDKKRITEILLFGSLVAVIFAVYDSIGEQLNYWATLENVLPIKINFFLGDLTLIPLYAMLVYQYTSTWKSYLIWITIWGGVFAFVYYGFVLNFLHVFVYLKKYSVLMDFILFLFTGIVARWIVTSLLKLERKGKES